MNDPNQFGYQDMTAAGAPGPGPPVAPNATLGQYKFSAEEMRVLQECNRESFFQRSLPLGAGLGLAAVTAVQQGYLKPNPRFGAFPKVTMAVIVGYFVGKLSYQQACAEKLMSLPGSYIGQLLRDRRDGKIGGTPVSGGQPAASPSMFGATPNDIYSDAGPGNALDLDSERTHVFSEDLSRPPTGSGEGSEPPPLRPSLSYDELRRRNRADQAATKEDPYRLDPNSAPVVRRSTRQPTPSTNAYGDVME